VSASHPFPYSSFKAYDIRGIVPTALNPEFAQELGRGLAARAHAAGVTALVVGRDGRLSSPALAQALQQGIRDGVSIQLMWVRCLRHSFILQHIRSKRAQVSPLRAATTLLNTTVSK